jgi:hypothetical protein
VCNIGLEQELFFVPRDSDRYYALPPGSAVHRSHAGQDVRPRPGGLRPLHGPHQHERPCAQVHAGDPVRMPQHRMTHAQEVEHSNLPRGGRARPWGFSSRSAAARRRRRRRSSSSSSSSSTMRFCSALTHRPERGRQQPNWPERPGSSRQPALALVLRPGASHVASFRRPGHRARGARPRPARPPPRIGGSWSPPRGRAPA